jgi:integrase
LELEQQQDFGTYSLFVFNIRSASTRDYYLRRLKGFFNHIDLLPNESIIKRCDYFAKRGKEDPDWAFNNIVRFLQFQRERVEQGEIAGSTLKNFLKALKLFCEVADIAVNWKKITRGLPKVRRYAEDRAPTIEEIQKLCEYPDRRIKSIIYVMVSSGIRLGAWDYLRWGHIKPVEKAGKTIGKVIVYSGDEEEYFTFITPEAYDEVKKWMDYRKASGEEINEKSWVMRQLWNAKKGRKFGLVTAPKKLQSSGVKRLVEDALWTQDIRNKSQINGKRYAFQSNHGFRKWFKTRCEMSGMRSINIEILMGHSIGISDSYYRITESELLDDYLKSIDFLCIDKEKQLQTHLHILGEQNNENSYLIKGKLKEKEDQIKGLEENVKLLQEGMNKIFAVIQQNNMLINVKPEILEKIVK